jgi:hypothetical protein
MYESSPGCVYMYATLESCIFNNLKHPSHKTDIQNHQSKSRQIPYSPLTRKTRHFVAVRDQQIHKFHNQIWTKRKGNLGAWGTIQPESSHALLYSQVGHFP